ncbi:3-ketoacyl-ACP reductase [Chitinophaga agrisoli]|uniref:3-ketoacyl-ACP reductase n=1 Tax=Chitinophaga agrisoli TaxID=2607653 RepID=A0A5B2VY09_9BACT|nr:3-ketoacyl-ACP reductase [Chitinophaga agrisoli]KAA2242919.1 3-ketoacyl-ACP reductase [Chitinophaga agrisoli]
MKVALITGGSRGIGLGIARHLAAGGYNLAINGIRPAAAVQEALTALRAYNVQVIYCQADIAYAEQRQQLLQQVKQQFGRLHVLVNNAGIAPRERKDILEATEQSFDEVLSTNLKGPYFLTQAVANWMIAQQQADQDCQGCIINISSISATIASVNRGEYCLAKAAMSMATQLFAVRLGAYNIPVYEVRPGIIETDMTAGVKDKYDRLIENGLCIQPRWGYPDDVGKAVAALAAGNFPYSTGQVIMVDGGLSVPRL